LVTLCLRRKWEQHLTHRPLISSADVTLCYLNGSLIHHQIDLRCPEVNTQIQVNQCLFMKRSNDLGNCARSCLIWTFAGLYRLKTYPHGPYGIQWASYLNSRTGKSRPRSVAPNRKGYLSQSNMNGPRCSNQVAYQDAVVKLLLVVLELLFLYIQNRVCTVYQGCDRACIQLPSVCSGSTSTFNEEYASEESSDS
jgi:hypothetical protein